MNCTQKKKLGSSNFQGLPSSYFLVEFKSYKKSSQSVTRSDDNENQAVILFSTVHISYIYTLRVGVSTGFLERAVRVCPVA